MSDMFKDLLNKKPYISKARNCSTCDIPLVQGTAPRSIILNGGRCRACEKTYRKNLRRPALCLEEIPGYIGDVALVQLDRQTYIDFLTFVIINVSSEPDKILEKIMQEYVKNEKIKLDM